MSLGRMLIMLGLLITALGVLVSLGKRLPGDIVIRGKHSVFYFPLGDLPANQRGSVAGSMADEPPLESRHRSHKPQGHGERIPHRIKARSGRLAEHCGLSGGGFHCDGEFRLQTTVACQHGRQTMP
jgi:hypothetical protein